MYLKDKSVIVYDLGIFIEVAIRLSKDFGKVYYYKPRTGVDKKFDDYMVGRGLDEIEKIDSFWDYVDKVDLIVFTDVYDGDLQEYLRNKGYLVWGCGKADDLETKRWELKQFVNKNNMPINECYHIKGITELKKFLKDKEDLYIKVSEFRGDIETFHHINFNLTEPFLDKKSLSLGIKKSDLIEFVVETPVCGIETGIDSYTINGKYPDIICHGYEIKDKGYIASIIDYKDLPKSLKYINDKISSIFKENESKGFFSTEVRIDDKGTPYLLDPCMRCGSPPTFCLIDIYDNISEIVFNGAQGELINPEPNSKFALEVIIYSDWAQYNWLPITFPEKYRNNIKLRHFCKVGDDYFIIPMGEGMNLAGSVVVHGDDLETMKKELEKICDSIECIDKDIKLSFIDTALEEIEKGKKVGINFDI